MLTSLRDACSLITYLSALNICPGNSDQSFLSLAETRGNKFNDQHGKKFKFKIKFCCVGQLIAKVETLLFRTVRYLDCIYMQKKQKLDVSCVPNIVTL